VINSTINVYDREAYKILLCKQTKAESTIMNFVGISQKPLHNTLRSCIRDFKSLAFKSYLNETFPHVS
jgi:hypothetical protein